MSSADRVQDVLTAISEAAATYVDPRGLYPRIHQLVGWLMPARNLYIALYDARNETVAMPYFVDQFDVPPGPEYRPMGHGLTEWVIRNRKPLLASQEAVDAMGARGEVDVLGMPSLDWLGAPLLVGNEVIGVIALQSYTQDERFTERHRDLLSFVSQQIAMSLRRHQAEAALRETTRRHAALVDNLPGVAFRCANDRDRTMEYMSEGVTELTGLTSQQLVGNREHTYASLILEEDRERVWQDIQKALEQRASYTTEYRIRTTHGQVRWVWERGRGVFTDDSLDAIEGFLVDATERMRASEERAALEARLGQAQKMESVGRLAGGVAHDLNNLLVPILGYAEILSEDLDKDIPHLEMLAHIRTAAHRARDLTRQLLAFSRKQILELRTIDLAATVREFLKLISRTIREDIRVTTAILEGPVMVHADVGQIEQVLMNLMLNAQDAMPRGGGLSIGVEAGGGRAVIAVRDSGVGMDERTREHLFEPFFTTKGPGKGTGLGLSTVYGIVKQHGGDVDVNTRPGQGTEIRISLPTVGETNAGRGTSVPEGAPTHQTHTGTVLLVEDNTPVREMTATILRRLGYTVICTSGGREALTHLDRGGQAVDLLLTDVVMPDMNGKDLAVRAQALRAGLPVLFTSGYTDDVIARHGVLEEGVSLLLKPFTPQALGDAVRAALDTRPSSSSPAGTRVFLCPCPGTSVSDPRPIVNILIGVLLIGINAFFAMAEYSLVRVRPSRVEELARKGRKLAGLIRFGLEHLNDYLSAVQFAITMTSLGLGWTAEAGVEELLRRLIPLLPLQLTEVASTTIAFVVSFLVMTSLHIAFGELLPKLLAIRTPERSATITIVPLTIMYYVSFAPMLVLNRTATALARLLSPRRSDADETHSEEEIKILLAQREEAGSLSLQHLVMFENLFDFGRATVREVMTPRTSIAYLSAARSAQENVAVMAQRKASRYPVCKTDLETVTGYVHIKDLAWETSSLTGGDLLAKARPVLRLRESLPLEECLHLFQERRVSMAVVTDGRKKVTGLLTTEDIVEEIVGEIRDEFERPQVYRLTDALVPEASEFTCPDQELLTILRGAVGRLHAARPVFNEQTALELVYRREQGLSSAVGYGAAFPHARIERLDRPLVGYTRCPEGVDLKSIDGKPVQMIFVILTPYHEPTAQLGLLSKLARMMLNETLRDRLSQAENREELLEVLRAFEDTVPI